MELNKAEFLAMNNPVRRLSQRYIEFATFRRFMARHNLSLTGATLLDAGCGSGFSSRLLWESFRPKELAAFDFMPEQIEIAAKRHPCADYSVNDITKISQPAEKFDAVFVFGILHHVPGWREALKELHRILKKGGCLFICEVNETGVQFVDRYFRFHHPEEARFSWQQFSAALLESDFTIAEQSKLVLDCFRAWMCIK